MIIKVASRIVSTFSRWKRYDESRQALAKVCLPFRICATVISINLCVYTHFIGAVAEDCVNQWPI